jgi:tetratricopeptide (TPR) repeat protein
MSRLLPILLCTAAIAGCATSSMQRARMADELRDHDLAVAEYTEALRQNPGDAEARAALDRAKVRAAAEHHLRGRRLMTLGRYEEAALELQIAVELNPGSQEAGRICARRAPPSAISSPPPTMPRPRSRRCWRRPPISSPKAPSCRTRSCRALSRPAARRRAASCTARSRCS